MQRRSLLATGLGALFLAGCGGATAVAGDGRRRLSGDIARTVSIELRRQLDDEVLSLEGLVDLYEEESGSRVLGADIHYRRPRGRTRLSLIGDDWLLARGWPRHRRDVLRLRTADDILLDQTVHRLQLAVDGHITIDSIILHFGRPFRRRRRFRRRWFGHRRRHRGRVGGWRRRRLGRRFRHGLRHRFRRRALRRWYKRGFGRQ